MNVPRSVELSERLKFEVIANVSQIIELRYQELFAFLTDIGHDQKMVDRADLKAILASCCWTIIDQSHAILQIFRISPRTTDGVIDKFYRNYSVKISHMRNNMDHIHQNVRNLSESKIVRPGLYGYIIFATPKTSANTFDIAAIPLGGRQFDREGIGPIDTQVIPLERDVSNIVFQSFESSIVLSELYRDMKFALNEFDRSLKDFYIPKLIDTALKNGVDPAVILGDTIAGSVFMRFRLEMGPRE